MAKGHLRMMEAFEEHLHAGTANFLLVNADGGKRRVHQHGFFAVVKADQANLFRDSDALMPQRTPEAIGDLIVSRDDSRRQWFARQNFARALLAEIDESLSIFGHDENGLEFVLAHGFLIALKSALNPGKRNVSGERDHAVALADEMTSGLKGSIEVVKANLVVLMFSVDANQIVAEGHEGHGYGSDSAQEIRIYSACEDDAVDQALLLENGRQVNLLGRSSRRVMQGGEEYVLFQSAGARLHALKNTRVERMEKVAIAQEKAHNFGAALENPARLGVRSKFETAYGVKNARARFLADMRAGIQHARNGSDTNARGASNVANSRLAWNCFHS